MKKFNKLMFMCLFIYFIGCSAEVNVTKCEMNVKQGNTDIPCGNGYFDFGDISLGYSQSITFTIENIGVADLNLTGNPKVEVSGQNASDFSAITNLTASTITAESETNFKIHFKPTSTGDRTATISIDNDDGNENPYTFVVVGKCKPAAVEINVKQGATDILCATGSYDFGSAYTGDTSSPVVFTIENSGNDNLVLSGNPPIAVVGADASMFYVNDDDTLSTISAGNSTTFEVSFRPVVSAGIKSAKISILSNDSDENPYTFTITGTAHAKPEINVKQGSTNIPCNTGTYDFSKNYLGKSSQEISFTVENIGAAQIDLTGSHDLIEISGADKAMFSINQTMTSASIAPGDSTTFTVIFTPTSEGMKSATISIENNDDDENPYTFTINGTGVTPEINVKQDYNTIENSTGKFEFIGVKVGASTSEIEFTIENMGTGNLLLNGSPIVEISGANVSEFSLITTATSNTITPGSRTTFKIQCNPVSQGLKTATISIVNNDLDENPYTFTITGFGVVYTEGDVNGDGLPDTIIGAYQNDSGGSNSGCAYLFFGKSTWSSSYDASNADVKLIGENPGNNFGYSVSIAGDVNNDGFEDIVVGAYKDGDGGQGSGCAFIFFGRYNWKSSVDASEANVKLIGADVDDYFGSFVTSGGDINNDGFKDVVVSAPHDDDGGNGSGCVFVFFGRSNWTSPIDASNANVKIVGEYNADNLGESISTAGDVNNDGINDIVVGAYGDATGGTRAGSAYIFFGRTSWSSTIDASNANVKLIGEDADDWFGRKLSSGGDVNNDGIDDIVIGAYLDDDGGDGSGCTFIFFGRTSWSSTIDASTANVKLIGDDTGDTFGSGVNCFGDVNDDGITDVVIGASSDDDGDSVSGCVFIFFGRTNWTTIIDASQANVKIIGEDTYDRLGSDVCISRDINNDGKMDLIIGAESAGTGMDYWGNAYIFFGQDSWNSSYDASNANVIIKGEANDDHFGDSLGAN